MVMEGEMTLGGEYTIQYKNDELYNSILETYLILLTNVTSITSMTFLKNMN